MPTNRPRVLVTGATGFIGHPLCHYLLEQGWFVRAVGRSPKFEITNPHLEYCTIENIGENTNWDPLLEGIDAIIHLAARVHHVKARKMHSLALYQETNVKGTQQLAKAAIRCNVKRFIYISSIKVNGEKTITMPFRAEDQPHPQDAYALSKLQAEQILQEESRRSGLEWVIIRPPLVYGPHVKGNFNRLMQLAKTFIPLPFLNIKNSRSLLSVYNLCSFIECCAKHPCARGEVFLVSDNQDVSTPQLIRLLREHRQFRSWLFPFPVSLLKLIGSLTGKRMEIDRMVDSLQVNIEKTERLLSWKPPFSLEASVQKLSAQPIEKLKSSIFRQA